MELRNRSWIGATVALVATFAFQGTADAQVAFASADGINVDVTYATDVAPIIQKDDLPICIACSQGNSLPPSQYFKGAIDEIRVYNRALSALEIEALYQGR